MTAVPVNVESSSLIRNAVGEENGRSVLVGMSAKEATRLADDLRDSAQALVEKPGMLSAVVLVIRT